MSEVVHTVSVRPIAVPLHDDREIDIGDTSKKQVIFTFDGGDGSQSLEGILAALSKHHVRGTFFLTGKWVEQNPVLVRRIAEAGHEIFNHTYDHKALTALPSPAVRDELEGMDAALFDLIGSSTRPYFRPPYGDRDARVRAMAAHDGFRAVYWTVDTLDWEEPQGRTAAEVRERIFSHVTPGTIYLMHLGDAITGMILDDVLSEVEARGYRAVSLTQGL